MKQRKNKSKETYFKNTNKEIGTWWKERSKKTMKTVRRGKMLLENVDNNKKKMLKQRNKQRKEARDKLLENSIKESV